MRNGFTRVGSLLLIALTVLISFSSNDSMRFNRKSKIECCSEKSRSCSDSAKTGEACCCVVCSTACTLHYYELGVVSFSRQTSYGIDTEKIHEDIFHTPTPPPPRNGVFRNVS